MLPFLLPVRYLSPGCLQCWLLERMQACVHNGVCLGAFCRWRLSSLSSCSSWSWIMCNSECTWCGAIFNTGSQDLVRIMINNWYAKSALWSKWIFLKQHYAVDLPLNFSFKVIFYDSSMCRAEDGTPVVDAAPPAGLVCENMPFLSGQPLVW